MAAAPLKPVDGRPKKIIVCCDGTWQSSVSGGHSLPSNITRIARTIAKAGAEEDGTIWQQIVFYDAGVGTGSLSWFESNRQGATGDGLVANVIEGYNFVVNNYSPGDKIYCFGFSRGAFTARAIAGMITDFGVIKPFSMQHFPSLFAAYKTNTSKYTFRKTKEYFEWLAGKAPLVPESQKETVYPKIPWYDTGKGSIEWEGSRSIEVVGVFDTVGSLGVADTYLRSHASSRQQYEWLNVKWNPYIKHAFHALALDDRRQPFLPTLYYIPNDKVIEEEKMAMKKDEEDWPELTAHRALVDRELEELRKNRQPDLVQVWFTGVHIHVGGGTDDAKTDFEGLANITFAWMVEMCKPYLAFEDFTNATITRYVSDIMADIDEQTKGTWQDAPSMANKAIGAVTGAVSGAVGSAGRWVGSWFAGAGDNAASKEKLVRSYCFSVIDNPPHHPAHWALFRPQDSYTLMYKAMSAPATRTPGECDDRSHEPYKLLADLGQTNEYVHPSVQWRLEQSRINDEDGYRYKSEALKGFVYTQKNGVAGWSKGKIWIQEWAIKGALQDEDPTDCRGNAEMALIDQCLDKVEAREFLRSHTVAWQKTQNLQSKPKK